MSFVSSDDLPGLGETVARLAMTNYAAAGQFPAFIEIAYKNPDGELEQTISFCLLKDKERGLFYETFGTVEVEAVHRPIRVFIDRA